MNKGIWICRSGAMDGNRCQIDKWLQAVEPLLIWKTKKKKKEKVCFVFQVSEAASGCWCQAIKEICRLQHKTTINPCFITKQLLTSFVHIQLKVPHLSFSLKFRSTFQSFLLPKFLNFIYRRRTLAQKDCWHLLQQGCASREQGEMKNITKIGLRTT